MSFRDKIMGANSLIKATIWMAMMAAFFCLIMLIFPPLARTFMMDAGTQIRILQCMQAIFLFIMPALLAAWTWSRNPFRWLHMTTGVSIQAAAATVLMMVCAQPGINLLASLNEQLPLPDSLRTMEDSAEQMIALLLKTNSFLGMIGGLVLIALLPALGEEMCFRGVLQGLLHREQDYVHPAPKRTHMAIWVTAILFSAFHMQFEGFIPRMLLGALLGYLLLWNGSLWMPIIAHFINNFCAIVFFYIGEHATRLFGPDTTINAEAIEHFGIEDQWWIGALSIAITLVMIWWVRRLSLCKSTLRHNH